MTAKTKFRCAGDSHPGMIRRNNEDRLHYDPERGIFLVIDGIGGQAAGEKAADIALSRVRARLERQTGTPEERIREAITVANNEIVRQAATNPEWQGMACVLTVAVAEDGAATIGHVGDSRLYKIRQGRIFKVTHDHSPVGEREDSRQISEAEAMRHPRRNEVYRDVGSEEHAPEDADFIEVQHIRFEPDSALLLCSDGLSDQVTSAEIRRAVEANAGSPGAAVRELIEAANRAGGKDNVTVLIVEGEQFAAARQAPGVAAAHGGGIATGRPAIFVYGLACATLIMAGLHYFGLLYKAPAPPPPPQTLRVGPGALGGIREALAKARPGDTVEVSSGEYREQVRLRGGVTLKGRAPDVPVLRADPNLSGPAAAMVAEGVHGAHVSGFRILASRDAPLAVGILIADSDVEIEDTAVDGAGTGIQIRGHATPVLRANTIENCLQTGIHISGNSAPQLRHNIIRSGLTIEDPARPVLEGNMFGENGGEPFTIPGSMSREAVLKYNFFLKPTRPARTPRGAAH